MRDTIRNGSIQYIVLDDGRNKGMKTVSQERGVDTHGTDLQYDTKDNIRIHTCRRGHICAYVYYLNTIVNFVL